MNIYIQSRKIKSAYLVSLEEAHINTNKKNAMTVMRSIQVEDYIEISLLRLFALVNLKIIKMKSKGRSVLCCWFLFLQV